MRKITALHQLVLVAQWTWVLADTGFANPIDVAQRKAELAEFVPTQCSVAELSCVSDAIGGYLGTDDVAVSFRSSWLSERAFVEAKAVDPVTDVLLHLVFASDGTYLSDGAVAAAERDRVIWIERFGKVSHELFDIFQRTPEDSRVPVGVWLRMRSDAYVLPGKALAGEVEPLESVDAMAAEARERFAAELSAIAYTADLDLYAFFGAPAFHGNLTPAQIRAISRLPSVANIDYAPPPTPMAACNGSWTWVQTVRLDLVWMYFGYNGSGQTVCVIESCYPDNYDFLRDVGTYYTGNGSCADAHATSVAATVANTFPNEPPGTAAGANTYLANWAGTPHGNISDPVYHGCRANGYRIWNFSHTTSDFDDRYFDYWVKRWPYPVITIAAGNAPNCDTYGGQGDGVSASSFNTMIVNATQDANTSVRSDDTLTTTCGWSGCWRNPCPHPAWCPAGDRELPLISAPGHALRMLGGFSSGTSFSSPAVAGVVALLHQGNATLAKWPEAVRAILIATATNDVDGTFFDPDDAATDERDGGGEVDAYWSAVVGSTSNYRTPASGPTTAGHAFGTIWFANDCPTGLCWAVYKIAGNSKGWPVRAVLTFDATASCTDASSEASCASDHLDADLDLRIRHIPSGNIVARSMSFDNSVEVVQFMPSSSQDVYQLEIWVARFDEPWTYYGVAWLTANFIDNP